MLKSGLYLLGKTLAALVLIGVLGFLPLAYGGTPGEPDLSWELYGVLILAAAFGVVVHEAGHLLACLAVGAEVKAFRIGGERAAIRFRVRGVQVSLGWPYRGRVQYGGARSVWRRALITLAGSFADLVLAGLVLMGAALATNGQEARPLLVAAALGLGAGGLTNLMPFRARSGRLTDGARLFELRSSLRVADLQATRRTAQRLLREGRTTELLALHARLDFPVRRTSTAQAAILAVIEFVTVSLPGLPDDAAQLAERRVSMLLRQHDLGTAESIAYLTLAVLQLRQGGADSCAEAERLCEQTLAISGGRDSVRRVAFAAVILSRKARGLSYGDVCAAVPTALKKSNYDPEPAAAGLKAILDPEAMLHDFRSGDPDARLGAGNIAAVLRQQGRTNDLLELHAGFELSAGRYAREQAQSLHEVEWNLLLVPGLPSEVIDEVASRTHWILDNYSFEDGDPMPRPAVQHTLGLARLRQGRFEEVESLCAAGLAADYGPDTRALVLATIAMGRRALGQPYADLIAEAVALSPQADLVGEAVRPIPEITH